MKKITRTFCSLTLCTFATLALSCGSQRNSDPDVLSIWHGFNAEEADFFRQELLPEFETYYEEKTGRDITLDVQFVDFGSMSTKLRTAALGNLTPDVAFVDKLKVPELAYGNALLPIDESEPFIEKYSDRDTAREEFVNASFDAGIVNVKGKTNLYGIPVQTTTVALYYNTDLFRQKSTELRDAGLDPSRPPRDWEEFIRYGEILTDEEKGIYGFGLDKSFWFSFPFFNMYGVDWIKFDENGFASPDLDNENARVAFERILKIVDSGIEGGAWRGGGQLGPSDGFLNRRYAMVFTGPWEVKNYTNTGIGFDVGLIPGPTPEEVEQLGLTPRVPMDEIEEYGQQAYSSSNVGGQTGVILRNTEDVDLSFAFLDYFSGEYVQKKWAEELGQIPVRLSAWDDLNTEKYPFMPRFMEQVELAELIPQIPSFGQMESNIFQPEYELFLKDQQSADQMITSMEDKMEGTILKFYNDALD